VTVFGAGSRYTGRAFGQPRADGGPIRFEEDKVKTLTLLTSLSAALLVVCAGNAKADTISGTIDSTLTITEDSDLTGDVTCTVSGAPCITINAPNITLRLNGYTMTGLADPQTGCNGSATGNELGILVNSQMFAFIQGPGVVQQSRNSGIQLTTSTGVTVIGVTTSTNCASGRRESVPAQADPERDESA
jgi:hypothetical protein